jgi:hypothetical protein
MEQGMFRNMVLAGTIIVMGLMVASPPSIAQTSVPKEIIWYHSVKVGFSKSAAKCNLKDPKMFASHLSKELEGIGIKRNPKSRVVATLSVSAKAFGLMDAQCAYNVIFQFQSLLNASEINVKDPRVNAALDRLGKLPISIYQDGVFGVVVLKGLSADNPVTAQKQVLEVTTGLVKRFKAARKK